MTTYRVKPVFDTEHILYVEAASPKEAACLFLTRLPFRKDIHVEAESGAFNVFPIEDLVSEYPDLETLLESGGALARGGEQKELLDKTHKLEREIHSVSGNFFLVKIGLLFVAGSVSFIAAVVPLISGLFHGDSRNSFDWDSILSCAAAGTLSALLGILLFLVIRRNRKLRKSITVKIGDNMPQQGTK